MRKKSQSRKTYLGINVESLLGVNCGYKEHKDVEVTHILLKLRVHKLSELLKGKDTLDPANKMFWVQPKSFCTFIFFKAIFNYGDI